jgi:SAM-dependent methyltransferase
MKTLSGVQDLMPSWLRRYVLHFEASIEDAVAGFAGGLPGRAIVLDAGAGEGQYRKWFARQRYVGLDLGIGDTGWDYRELDAIADLRQLPLRTGSIDAALNIVTLEHVPDPLCVLAELYRALRPGGRLLLVVPHEWEEHQQPHDFYRYTRYGVEHLLRHAGFDQVDIRPVGGYFRLLSRRLLNGLQFFPGLFVLPAALLLVPPALLLPLFEPLDRKQNCTLGFVCLTGKS